MQRHQSCSRRLKDSRRCHPPPCRALLRPSAERRLPGQGLSVFARQTQRINTMPEAQQAPGEAKTYLLRQLGRLDYSTVFEAQRAFTDSRDAGTQDEIWLVEHEPVFTQGQAGKAEHVLDAGDIPVVQSDRGGQITYHGPGQVVLYLLADLRRNGWGVRTAVTALESAVISLLAEHDVQAAADPHAPGVYVQGAKIAALGLRVRKGRCYHGVALNVDLDLAPYQRINPCGYAGQGVTSTTALGLVGDVDVMGQALVSQLAAHLKYTGRDITQGLPPLPND